MIVFQIFTASVWGSLSLFKSKKPFSNYEIALWNLITCNTDQRFLTWGRNNTENSNPYERYMEQAGL